MDSAKVNEATSDADAAASVLEATVLSTDPVKDYLQQIGGVPLLNASEEVELAKRIEAGLIAARKIASGEVDDVDLRLDLEWIVEDGLRAEQHFLEANLRLVVSVARRYNVPGMPMLDLVQEGNLGLIKAVHKFDYARGNRFSTHAIWWIRQAITRALSEQSRVIRVPAHVADQITRLRRANRKLQTQHERQPTVEELAAELELTEERVKALQGYDRDPVPLDAPVGADEATALFELLTDSDAINPEEAVAFHILQGMLDSLLDSLDPREADIIRKRFGLWDGRIWKLGEVATSYGLTRERIRQIETKALGKLRHPSRAQKLQDFAA